MKWQSRSKQAGQSIKKYSKRPWDTRGKDRLEVSRKNKLDMLSKKQSEFKLRSGDPKCALRNKDIILYNQ